MLAIARPWSCIDGTQPQSSIYVVHREISRNQEPSLSCKARGNGNVGLTVTHRNSRERTSEQQRSPPSVEHGAIPSQQNSRFILPENSRTLVENQSYRIPASSKHHYSSN